MRVITKEDQTAYLNLLCSCFNPDGKSFYEQDFLNTSPEVGTILGIDENNDIASSLVILNKQMKLNDLHVPMGGIAYVATDPLYRGKGHVRQLFEETFKRMKESGMVFSLLAPFKYEFYEQFGYKACYERFVLTVPMSVIGGLKPSLTFSRVTSDSWSTLEPVYEKVNRHKNGWCKRTSNDVAKVFADTDGCIVVSNEQNEICGYMIYKVIYSEQTLLIKELMFEDASALKSLLHYASRFEAQVSNVRIFTDEASFIQDVLPTPRINVTFEAGMMGRVVDAKSALAGYPFVGREDVVIQVTDKYCEWNHQTFKVTRTGDKCNVEVTTDTPQMHIDITSFSQLMMGFRTFKDLVRLEAIEVFDESVAQSFLTTTTKTALYDAF